ncbi:MAG: hypothetical protein NVV70_12830 [Cellulomonas sp.]|uniref:Uncharacterized protein n=3 Tax=Cellulomonas gelida TaxID=1712 RepID=A0A4Y3KSC3_9CELL|nr:MULTISPECIES: hypothetical protein [Cellulomonas]KMM44329.1 hypothetical protein CWIS_16570 [Cellulomonas sp. A375-1]MCR6648968.1 hypothetical protein [Cellulomonas sp.]MCR6704957.1 hypothetical protein [Cellulomonas sp.]GEA85830.1 hypothetical protein CGE01nite_30810 [Cellulomonas gelida]
MPLLPASRVPALVALGGLLAGGISGAFAASALAGSEPAAGPAVPTAIAAPRFTVRYDPQHVLGDLLEALRPVDSYAFTLALDPQAPELTGAAMRDDDRWDLVGRIEEDGTVTELRLIGDDAYAFISGLTDGFGRTSRDEPGDPFVAAYIDSFGPAELATTLAETRDAVVSVSAGGASVELDQVPAQPFDVVVDLRRATGAMGSRFTSGATTNAYAMMRLWIGPDGLVRRYTEPKTSLQVDFTRWGEDVVIEAPDDAVELDLGG